MAKAFCPQTYRIQKQHRLLVLVYYLLKVQEMGPRRFWRCAWLFYALNCESRKEILLQAGNDRGQGVEKSVRRRVVFGERDFLSLKQGLFKEDLKIRSVPHPSDRLLRGWRPKERQAQSRAVFFAADRPPHLSASVKRARPWFAACRATGGFFEGSKLVGCIECASSAPNNASTSHHPHGQLREGDNLGSYALHATSRRGAYMMR
jgi:hypothetical protein